MNMDLPGFEPGASRTPSGRDTVSPQARFNFKLINYL